MPIYSSQSKLIALAFLLFITGVLVGCATTAPPKGSELSDIEAGKRTLVLIRVAASINGKPHEPFSGSLVDDNVGIAVGTFETGGRVQRLESLRFLSEASREQGWTYFSVLPGTFYLAFLPPRRRNLYTYLEMFQSALLWRVDVPEGGEFIYAGTLAVDGDGGFLLFGGQYLENFKHMEILDERDEAQSLVDERLPSVGPIDTVLMQRHEGPIILTTPND